MKYLIIHENEPFYTNWFDVENNFVKGMLVIDMQTDTYTIDGVTWLIVEEDHL